MKLLTALSLLITFSVSAQETLLLRCPSVSNDHIAFAYGGDVWLADKDGLHPQRLTVNQGVESNPMFSPDGKWIAFTGNYDGNDDVYVIPVTGGEPKRLTYHPAEELVRGWDGNDKIIFNSRRESRHFFLPKLFEVSISTGREEVMPMPEADNGSVSPDGKYTVYTRTVDINELSAFRLYRGGNMPRVWIFNNQTYEFEEIPAAHSNNIDPVWTDNNTIYFLSDRDNHYMNVYKYDRTSKQVTQVTSHKDFDVKTLYSNGHELAYEQGGKIYVLNVSGGTSHIPVTINEDMISKRAYYADAKGMIRNVNISPSGIRAVMEIRGDIVTVPADKGDVRNITNTPSVNERDPAWSPDGKYIAYFSDEDGEYKLKISDQKGEKKAEIITLDSANFYYHPVWSPDSKKIAYTDKQRKLYIIDIKDKKPVEIDQDWYTPGQPQINYAWSPDSKWITYNNRLGNHFSAIFLYDVAKKEKHQITDARSEANYPVFSKDGKYLFFTASTNFGPAQSWLDLSSYNYYVLDNIYAIVLSKKNPSILEPESDEETVKTDGDEKTSSNNKDSKKLKSTATKKDSLTADVIIDLDNIDQRIVALPVPAKNISGLSTGVDGQLLYLSQDYKANNYTLNSYDIAKRKTDEVKTNIYGYYISNDGKKMLYASAGDNYAIADMPGKPKPSEGVLNIAAIKIYVDPTKEWTQMYNEVWRLERDFLYVKNANGANLEALKKKYAVFLPYVVHRDDLSYLFNSMLGELVLGHVFVGGGVFPETKEVNVGLLGADYELVNGYYQFKKIYSGLNWNPDLTAPLTQPGINVKEGQYLVAVNGIPLDSSKNLYSLFQNTAGKQIRISVNTKPSAEGAKDFTVVPIPYDNQLRMMNWVEGNRKKVDSLSGGRIAYVYLPNTADLGYDYFNRYFFSQLDKQAVIADDRDNMGGYAADYIVDLLARNTVMYSNKRDGKPFSIPNAVINGPKVMLTNFHSLSGGDLMPYMFRAKNVGKLVGTRTLGILVGNAGNPDLMDGGHVTTPNIGIFGTDEKWIIENEGVAPDVEVDNMPKDEINGHDTQLEKAVELILKDMKPYKEVQQPADPIRVADY
ncbi:MAG: S41 family peptidase [Ilyomonas sp.]